VLAKNHVFSPPFREINYKYILYKIKTIFISKKFVLILSLFNNKIKQFYAQMKKSLKKFKAFCI